jgi:hypothetical protein
MAWCKEDLIISCPIAREASDGPAPNWLKEFLNGLLCGQTLCALLGVRFAPETDGNALQLGFDSLAARMYGNGSFSTPLMDIGFLVNWRHNLLHTFKVQRRPQHCPYSLCNIARFNRLFVMVAYVLEVSTRGSWLPAACAEAWIAVGIAPVG